MNSNLLILGSGAYALQAQQIALELDKFSKIMIYEGDITTPEHKWKVMEMVTLEYKYGIVTIEDPVERMQAMDMLESWGCMITKLIHPMTDISPLSEISKGCVIDGGTIADHLCKIGVGTLVGKNSRIGREALIGNGCLLKDRANIKPKSILRAGSVVEGLA